MAGLFDMPGLDMSTIVGLLPRMQEARQNAQMMEGASMLAGGNELPPTPPMAPQGLDPTGSAPTSGTGIFPTQPAPPAQPLDVPDNIAKAAAARGVPPPKMDLPSWASTDPTVGAALTGKPSIPMPTARPTDMSAMAKPAGAPMDITSEAQKAGGAAAPAAGGDKMGEIAKALRGVTMPKNPELQKISSPSAPRATSSIKGGDLMMLLQALNAGPGVGGGLKLPSTLGQALGGK